MLLRVWTRNPKTHHIFSWLLFFSLFIIQVSCENLQAFIGEAYVVQTDQERQMCRTDTSCELHWAEMAHRTQCHPGHHPRGASVLCEIPVLIMSQK